MSNEKYKNCTMEQLWGNGGVKQPSQNNTVQQPAVRKRKDSKLYCLQLENESFATVDTEHNSIGSVKTMEFADLFTRDEAEEVCRRFWIRAKAVPFKEKIG